MLVGEDLPTGTALRLNTCEAHPSWGCALLWSRLTVVATVRPRVEAVGRGGLPKERRFNGEKVEKQGKKLREGCRWLVDDAPSILSPSAFPDYLCSPGRAPKMSPSAGGGKTIKGKISTAGHVQQLVALVRVPHLRVRVARRVRHSCSRATLGRRKGPECTLKPCSVVHDACPVRV